MLQGSLIYAACMHTDDGSSHLSAIHKYKHSRETVYLLTLHLRAPEHPQVS